MNHCTLRNSSTRLGFTLVELLVVIAIIGTLVGLLLPAVNSARERARQATCTNNLSELGKAMISYATNGKGVFPGYMQLQKLDPTAYDCYPPTPATQNPGNVPIPDVEVSWAAKLLPRIDQQGLWDSLVGGKLDLSDDLSDKPDEIQQIELFICPSNPPTRANDAVLTYVANTGAPDLRPNASIPQSDYAANGICHNLINAPTAFDMKGPTVRYGSDLKDGAGTTFLLSENVHKDETDSTGSTALFTSWLRSSAFYMGGLTAGEQPFGMVWVYEAANPLNPRAAAQERINRDSRAPIELGDMFYQMGTRFTRPASEHPEVVIAVFAGGNTKSISEAIEYRVYQQLMTPNGANSQLVDFPNVQDPENVEMRDNYNVPPLSDADY